LNRTGENKCGGDAFLSRRDSGEVVLASLRGICKPDIRTTERFIQSK
jgi:hypothetical protein